MPVQVELVSPERILYSGEADMVIARTVGGGDIAFLPGHAPFVGALEIATVTLRTSEGDQLVAVHGGFVEVSNDTVTILSDVAELGDDIDVGRAERAREVAQREHEDHDGEASAALRRAHVRLAAAGAGPAGT
jgi:F-type H+-transporting ATPase subunit epsilon